MVDPGFCDFFPVDQDSPPSSGYSTPFSLENCLQFFFFCGLEGAGNLGTPHPLVTGMGIWPRPGQVEFSLGLAQEVGVRRTEKRIERERGRGRETDGDKESPRGFV